MEREYIDYERCAFFTRLETDRLYTPGHFWLRPQAERLWRVGLTKFATRVLGDLVEFDIEVRPGTRIEAGEVIGRIEGFKAVSDLCSPIAGLFKETNRQLVNKISLLDSDPHGDGWLYLIEGSVGDDCLEAEGYASILDATIDEMRGEPDVRM